MNRLILLAGLCGLLAGCGVQEAVPKIAKVVLDPSIAVGPPDDKPREISLYAYASTDMNKNFDGEPSPVVVKVFALSADHRLFALDFFTIVSDPKSAFGVTLVEELDENMLAPGAYNLVGTYEIPKKARKIAVVAEYLDIDTTVWRASIDVKSADSEGRLLLLLLKDEVKLTTGRDMK